MNIKVKKVKIIVTSPPQNADEIRNVIGNAGAGIIGNYTHCSISSDCIGIFKGNDKSNPYIGTKNQIELVKEIKIEVQCEVEKIKKVLKALREVHPYEEVAVDIVPLIDENDL